MLHAKYIFKSGKFEISVCPCVAELDHHPVRDRFCCMDIFYATTHANSGAAIY